MGGYSTVLLAINLQIYMVMGIGVQRGLGGWDGICT
jgi:hypothetical protein